MNSNLQIISGRYRGRKLTLPRDARPTQNRARMALFNMLTPMVDGSKSFAVWDAFAGSGAFGVEFLSRYENATVFFTDISAESFKVINKNAFGLGNARIEMSDALNAVKRIGPIADIVFVDPPYAEHDLGISLVRKLANLTKPGTIVVWEMDSDADAKLSDGAWDVLRDKSYGRARFLILSKI